MVYLDLFAGLRMDQLLELKLYISMLSMEFFFDQVDPSSSDSMDFIELIAHHPISCLVKPKPWSDLHSSSL